MPRAAIVLMTLKFSPLSRHLHLLKLLRNMRLKVLETEAHAEKHVLQYYEYLLVVKEGRIRQNQELKLNYRPV